MALNRALFTLLAIFLITPSAAFAQANPTLGESVTPTTNLGPPVEINECSLLYRGGWLAGKSAGMKVQFTNDTNKTADLINFYVSSGTQGGNIRDVGTFSPGVEITHTYRAGDGQMMFAPIFSHPHITCSVASVRFADGTVWRANQAAVSAENRSVSMQPRGPIGLSTSALSFAQTGSAAGQFLTVSSKTSVSLKESDNCSSIAVVKKLSAVENSIVFRIDPLGPGACGITLVDDAGNTALVPIAVQLPDKAQH